MHVPPLSSLTRALTASTLLLAMGGCINVDAVAPPLVFAFQADIPRHDFPEEFEEVSFQATVGLVTGDGSTRIGLGIQEGVPGARVGWQVRAGTCAVPGAEIGVAAGSFPDVTLDHVGIGEAIIARPGNISGTTDYHVRFFGDPTGVRFPLICGDFVLQS